MLHFIAGMPRSGSTLLCNILAQNSANHVTTTSPHLQAIRAVTEVMGLPIAEFNAYLTVNPDAYERLRGGLLGFSRGWYADVQTETIFEKSRLAQFLGPIIQDVYSDSIIFCLIRDPVEIIASIEKQHRVTAAVELDAGRTRTLASKIDALLAPDGLVGSNMNGIMDLIDRRIPNVQLIKYGAFVARPATILQDVYTAIGKDTYNHKFQEVMLAHQDADAAWYNKFPHTGVGDVRPADPAEIDKYLSADAIAYIKQQTRRFRDKFQYSDT